MSRSGRIIGSVMLVTMLAAACSAAPVNTGRPASTPAPPAHTWPEPAPTLREVPREPYPDVEFKDPGVNPFVDPQRDPLSTFAMDVDTASYSIARRFIEDGHLPERDSVRLEEYVNSFDYGYESPREGVFAIHLDGAPTPFNSSRSTLLRIGIQSLTIADEERSPVSLTFVVDTSGSMQMENRLELVKEALGILVGELGPDDSVAIVEFGSDARVVLSPTSAAEPEAILHAIRVLEPGGSTNAQAGLELGYDLAELGHRPGANDRVIIASDGVANVGLTDADSILRRIDRAMESGIDLVAVGVGMGNFNDVLLEQLANRGNGFYAYVNDRREAERLFRDGLTATLQTIARDAKVQVEFHSETVARYRLLGYENRALADEDFRNPEVDAGEVGAGHSVTALYEIELYREGGDGHLGTVRLRWADVDSGSEEHLERDIELADLTRDFESADAGFRLAATVGAFAEILRESPSVSGYSLRDVAHEAEHLARWFDGREDVEEFRWLAEQAARLADR
jgi:Ca-activated chloride channel homolog